MMKYLVLGVVALVVAVTLIGAYLTPDDLEKCGGTPTSEKGCEAVDAIVAVSGGNTSLRAAEAITLYKNGWAKYLIFSGAAQDQTGPSNAAVMQQQAIKAGVPTKAILVEGNSRTTHQNAENTRSLFERNNFKSIIVVTSPYHQRRAGIEFRDILNGEVMVQNHPVADDPDWTWYWWATPRGWWLGIGELVKIGATHAGESR